MLKIGEEITLTGTLEEIVRYFEQKHINKKLNNFANIKITNIGNDETFIGVSLQDAYIKSDELKKNKESHTIKIEGIIYPDKIDDQGITTYEVLGKKVIPFVFSEVTSDNNDYDYCKVVLVVIVDIDNEERTSVHMNIEDNSVKNNILEPISYDIFPGGNFISFEWSRETFDESFRTYFHFDNDIKNDLSTLKISNCLSYYRCKLIKICIIQ